MLTPTTEQDVAEMVRGANGSLTVRGGGTRSLEAGAGEVISTAGMSGVTLYEPGALTIVAQAGTPVSEIEAVLAAENQRLPFEPPRMGAVGTIRREHHWRCGCGQCEWSAPCAGWGLS